MSLSLILAALWALAATGVAFLPMRRQRLPGGVLVLLAPVLLGYIALQHGIWILLLALLAFVSMFRRPLRYLILRAMGRPATLPSEFANPEHARGKPEEKP